MCRKSNSLSYFSFRIFLLVAFMGCFFFSRAQYYNLGQDPSSIKWRQINTEHFKLIYPSDFEVSAQRLINLFTYVYDHGTHTLGCKPSKVPLIVHNRDIVPNAFTLWAPKRIELYTCPPQNTYAQDWLEQLAIHEYRHVVQMDMMNHGFTRFMTWIVGEQATAAATGLFVPMWFMEGDAVCAETALSHSGRGRIPSFEMEIRAQILEKGLFSYDKAIFGSFRDYMPDQYAFGYPLVAMTRSKFGYRQWINTMDYVAKYPFTITPLNFGLKRTTGMNKTGLYKYVYKTLDSLWKQQAAKEAYTASKPISLQESGEYRRYKYPHYANDSMIIAERSGLDDISRFVVLDQFGNEKVLCTPGFYSSDVYSINIGTGAFSSGNKPGAFSADNLSICNGMMAWTERETDPRWQNRNYSVIRIYDFKSGEIRRLTSKSRYFSPSISPDGSKLLVVKVSWDNVSSLVLLDMLTGKELETFMSSPVDVHLNPVWSSDGNRFVYMILSEHGKGIYQYSVPDHSNTCMLQPSFTEISSPTYAGRYILFNGPYSGIENVYSIDTSTRNIYKVTSAPFGACNADYNHNTGKIVYSDYNSLGYRIVEADFNPSLWTPVSNVQDNSIGLYKDLIKDETGLLDSLSVPDKVYESEPYKKSTHLFSFHSWAPFYFNYPLSETGAGLSFMSQNDLSTATTIVGYDWDYTGNTGQFKASFNYAGWYPILDIDLASGSRSITFEPEGHSNHRYTWNEQKISGGISLPLLFSKSKYYTGIQLKAHATMQYASNSTAPDTLSIYREGWVSTLDYRILWYHYLKQAQKDVYPRFGQSIDLNYRFSPFGSKSYGSIASSEISLFLPGFFKHHGTRFYAGYQSKVNKDLAYGDLVNVARGYPIYRHEKMLSFAMNYKFPFAYPDVKLGPFAYIKRLKANLFYDHTKLYDDGKWYLRNSIGTEITADMHVFRFLLPLDSGVRVGYLLHDNSWFVNLLFSVNLSI